MITITFTESDQQTAAEYCDGANCIIATALRRMNIDFVSVAGSYVRFADGEKLDISDPDVVPDHIVGKSYDPAIVGKTITLK